MVMDSRISGSNPFNFDESALSVFEQRSTLLTRNIANASTPNYKARDINFNEILKQQQSSKNVVLESSHVNHLQAKDSIGNYKQYYRVPMQVSQDGNTVDDEIEKTKFVENTLRYQASLSFIQSRKSTLVKAIRGD